MDRRDRVAALTAFNWTKFSVDSPTVFINVENGEAVNMEGTTSRHNNRSIFLVVDKLAAMIAGDMMGISGAVIIVSYIDQVLTYRNALEKASREATPGYSKLPNMTVGTIDSFEGTESPFMIMDTIVRDKIDFMSDPSHINVSLSRAK